MLVVCGKLKITEQSWYVTSDNSEKTIYYQFSVKGFTNNAIGLIPIPGNIRQLNTSNSGFMDTMISKIDAAYSEENLNVSRSNYVSCQAINSIETLVSAVFNINSTYSSDTPLVIPKSTLKRLNQYYPNYEFVLIHFSDLRSDNNTNNRLFIQAPIGITYAEQLIFQDLDNQRLHFIPSLRTRKYEMYDGTDEWSNSDRIESKKIKNTFNTRREYVLVSNMFAQDNNHYSLPNSLLEEMPWIPHLKNKYSIFSLDSMYCNMDMFVSVIDPQEITFSIKNLLFKTAQTQSSKKILITDTSY